MMTMMMSNDIEDDESCAGALTAQWAGDEGPRWGCLRWTNSYHWASTAQISQANRGHSAVTVGTTDVVGQVQHQQPASAL